MKTLETRHHYVSVINGNYIMTTPLIDYLLSNNHINSIIVHKFDFSDEEVLAYYISFLKTLSFKLNNHTIHFFYNEVSVRREGVCLLLLYCNST